MFHVEFPLPSDLQCAAKSRDVIVVWIDRHLGTEVVILADDGLLTFGHVTQDWQIHLRWDE